MKMRSRIKSINGELCLPEAMIQHIQSFLSPKEAARTTILSKSWFNSWSTRPNLGFDLRDFVRNKDCFWEFVKKTMQRYEALNLKIESVSLFIPTCSFSICDDKLYEKVMDIVKELIVKATKMGTVDFNFETELSPITSPREVLGFGTLIRLCLCRVDIELGEERKIRCAGVKSLSLRDVYLKKNTLWDIVSRCPSIENLTLQGLGSSVSIVNAPIYKLCKLKSLFLGHVDVDASFFIDLSSKFPFLKELSLHNCGGYNYKGIELCSRSLECVCFEQSNMLRAKCSVPNIRKFKFVGESLPSLSFKTASSEWESDITVRYSRVNNAKWFHKLNELLTCLSLSRITLSLSVDDGHMVVETDLDFQSLPSVENLQVHASCTLWNCLFRSCHPKFITQNWYPYLGDTILLKILRKKLEKRVRGSDVLQDLRGINVEVSEENVAEWRPLSWKKLLDTSSAPQNRQKVRFQLIWRPKL